MTRDPIGYEGGINLYGYCESGPIGTSDPWGLSPLDGDDAASGAILGGLTGQLGNPRGRRSNRSGSGSGVGAAGASGITLIALGLGGCSAMATGFRDGLTAMSGGHLLPGDDAHHKVPKKPSMVNDVHQRYGQHGSDRIKNPHENATNWPSREHRSRHDEYQTWMDWYYRTYPNATEDEFWDFAKWLTRRMRGGKPPFRR